MSERPYLAVVGGFLGAGKTTLILAAARILAKGGIKSAVILNDQGDALVDTSLAREHGFEAGEVTGGCFCCRFSDLAQTADRLSGHAPQVIFAEPVGSCIDLVATVLRPLASQYAAHYRIAPFTVVMDPSRAGVLADPRMTYLFQQQIAEADLVCFTRSDMYSHYPPLIGVPVRIVSGKTGQGVEAWLDELFSGALTPGTRTLDVDYEVYARAEAALAWLNCEAALAFAPPRTPAMVVGTLLDVIDTELTRAYIGIAHMKAIDYSPAGYLKAAICANGQEALIDGDLDASPAAFHELILNLRAAGPPETVRAIVESALAALGGETSDVRLQCFQPAPPKPEKRAAPEP